jgi:hypothetical protein
MTASASKYMHFGKGGEILDAYDPARSCLPISVFPTGQVNGLPTAAQLKAAGFSQASVGGFILNPNDRPGGWRGWTFEDWLAYTIPTYQDLVRPYVDAGLLLHHPMDAMVGRTPAEQEFVANCPWATKAITATVANFDPSVINLSMEDEIGGDPKAGLSGSWNGISYTLPAGFYAKLRALMQKPVGWPVFVGATNATEWDKIADFCDIYYTTPPPSYNRYTLFEQVCYAKQFQLARIDPTKPWTTISPLASETPTAPPMVPGSVVIGMMMHSLLIMGAAGLRMYSWSPAFPNWAEVLAAATIGNNWLQAHVADIIQPLLDPPKCPAWFTSSRRDRALTYVNMGDAPLPLTCESFGTRHVISVNGVIVTQGIGVQDSLVVTANAVVVYLR